MTPENLENEVGAAMAFEPNDMPYDGAGVSGDSAHGRPSATGNEARKGTRKGPRKEARKEAEALFAEIDAAAQEESLASGHEDEHSDLDSVPVTLSFELGKASLPLADVRTLGQGAVVLFAGGSPASVAIVSAGQTLGYGEVVDVEGQLGIRVTRWRKP